jgi:hypothetical protein
MRSFPDWFSDTILVPIRPIVNLLMKKEITVHHTGMVIPKKHEPFILVSNHFNTWDSFVIMKNVKKNVRFVATEIAYLDLSKKIGMHHLARTIKKRVGKHEVLAARNIFRALENGYGVGLFPEGDNTFYGETLDIYTSTGKLLKRANVDIILIKQQGGYISQPRWADYFSKKGHVFTTTEVLIKKEQLPTLSPSQINDIIRKAIYNNDYEFQREKRINFDRKNRAEGIERLVYRCNQCGSILSITGKGHDIHCTHCGIIGTINEYEFIEGNKHDNLVDYNHEQYQHIEDAINGSFSFPVTFNIVNTTKLKNIKQGTYNVHYKDKKLRVENGTKEYIFELSKIKYPVNTMRHSFSFDYEDQTYNFTDIRHQFVLYEMCRYINGSYKE